MVSGTARRDPAFQQAFAALGPSGLPVIFPDVNGMLILGVCLDSRGSSAVSVEYKLASVQASFSPDVDKWLVGGSLSERDLPGFISCWLREGSGVLEVGFPVSLAFKAGKCGVLIASTNVFRISGSELKASYVTRRELPRLSVEP